VPRENVALGNAKEFYNHGYVIIDLDGPAAHVRYYQDSNPSQPLYEEDM
jgi:hypothetical protein